MSVSRCSRVSATARGAALLLALASTMGLAVAQGGAPVCVPGTNPLQAAVDAAQPGDAIDVGANPNLGQRVCVTKPLLFFSTTMPPATVTASPGLSSFATPQGVFHIDPAVSGVVAFQNLQILGMTTGTLPGPDGVMRGIYSQSANVTVVVDGCTVSGANYPSTSTGDNSQNGADGIEGAVARLVVMDSQISGGDADYADWSNPGNLPCFPDPALAGNGGDAIDVTGEAILVRSTLAGGNGGDAVSAVLPCGCAPPPASYAVAGSGGSAVVAPTVWSWGCTGTPGVGGVIRCGPAIYGSAPSGAGLSPGEIPFLQVGPQPALGGTVALTVLVSLPAAIGVGTTGFGSSVLVPGAGPYFLGPSPILFPAAPAPAGNSVPIPMDPALMGLVLPVQAVFQPSAGAFLLTNPDVVLILP